MNYTNVFSNVFSYDNIYNNILWGGYIGLNHWFKKKYYSLPPINVPADEVTQADIKEKAKKLSILKPLKIRILSSDTWGDVYAAGGTPFSWETEIGIKPDTNDWLKYHELSHIAYNHNLKTCILEEIAQLSTFYLFMIKPWPVAVANFILAKLIMTIVGKYFEKQADMSAAQHATLEDTIKAISMFEERRLHCKVNRELGAYSKLTVSSRGNLQYIGFPHFFDDHPLYTTRINYLSKYFYDSERKFPLSAFIYCENLKKENEIILSKESITKIRSLISKSNKRIAWIGLNKILICPTTNTIVAHFADKENGSSILLESNHNNFSKESTVADVKESTVVDVIDQLLKRTICASIVTVNKNGSANEADVENIKAKLQDQFIIDQITYKNYLKDGRECSDIVANVYEKHRPNLSAFSTSWFI